MFGDSYSNSAGECAGNCLRNDLAVTRVTPAAFPCVIWRYTDSGNKQ